MAPKASGGAGKRSAQNYVASLWAQGLDEEAVRRRLQEDGYKSARVSQLLKATRPAQPAADHASNEVSDHSGQEAAQPAAVAMDVDSESDAEEGDDEELGVVSVATYLAEVNASNQQERAELDAGDVHRLEVLEEGTESNSNDGGGTLAEEAADELAPALIEISSSDDSVEESAEDGPEAVEEEEEEPDRKRRRIKGAQPPPTNDPVMKRAAAQKKPASRGPWPNERCAGYDGAPCRFNPQAPGQPARVHPDRGDTACPFCDKAKMQAAAPVTRCNRLTTALKCFLTRDESIYEAALARVQLFVGEEQAQQFATRVRAAQQRGARRAAGPAPPAATWEHCLSNRQSIEKKLSDRCRQEYDAAVQRDQRVARRKIFFPDKLLKRAGTAEEEAEKEEVRQVGEIGHVAPNDTDLPMPSDPTARKVEEWCKSGSWGMCEKCHSMCARPLRPMDLRRAAKATVPASQCTACKHDEYVPQPEHVPAPLRKLKPKVLVALRPLDVDTGVAERAQYGYRVHTCMITFAWSQESVQRKIAKLRKRRDRQAARAALDFLLTSQDSAYGQFLERHEAFLAKHGDDAPEKVRKRPLRFIEEEGLECCLWPHLYWHRNLCETVARASHEARRERGQSSKPAGAPMRRVADSTSEDEDEQGRAAASAGTDGAETQAADDEEQEDAQGGEEAEDLDEDPGVQISETKLGRIKRGFIRKVLSPVMGYGADYELLHFVYDLSMWTTIGAKKNVASRSGVSLRIVLKGAPWTPQYWRVRHQAVIDMQRQCGNATLFRTHAPYERTFPYHRWVMHEQDALGRARMGLAGAETLHMAHVLLQLDNGYFRGSMARTGRADRTWQGHLLGPEDVASGCSTVKAHVTRLEFQDGKRKRATQKYHGRGTTHSHSLDFLENVRAIGLERKLSASIPPADTQPFLHGLVRDSQQDYKDSKLPVREEESAWDEEEQKLLLHHSEEDKAAHVRAYFPSAMEITKCHEDVQWGDGNGAVLRYVATYNTKFSSSMNNDWLNDDASDYSVARRVLCGHKPLEPEMWLTLAQERFPQVAFSGTLVDVMPPTPECAEKPAWVETYEEAEWRRKDMPLIEFLRKSNADGHVIHYIQEAHKRRVMEQVQAKMGEDDRTFARRRKQLLSAFHNHKKECKRRGDQPSGLAEFLEDEAGVDGLTPLESFANDYETRGEKLVAATMHSMLNDKYYGQWLALHVPFRRLEQFVEDAAEVMEHVPQKYRNFALCLHHAPDFWESEGALKRTAKPTSTRSSARFARSGTCCSDTSRVRSTSRRW